MNKCLSFDYSEQYYQLWWEYLRRSKDYKKFCLWMREKRKNPDLKIPEKFAVNRWKRLWLTFAFNNDVHFYSFDGWLEYKRNNFGLTKKSHEKEVINKYNDFVKSDIKSVIGFLKNILERDPTLDELQRYYDDNPYGDGVYVIRPFVVDSKIAIKLIQEKIKGQGYRRQSIRYDELERYLKVYDLKEEGKTMSEVIKIIAPGQNGEHVDILRSFRRDLAKAKKIIANTESGSAPGSFPGVYSR